jgi:NADPH-dependent 2,4-dienoyl-CoA reductase/sulfur reductase-like enzyme/ferredoxin
LHQAHDAVATITFPNFMELPSYLPKWAWRVLRAFSVLGALGIAALLWLRPEVGLPLFWGLVVPVLPLVFMLTPGLWRNLCPLATSNQMPRRMGIAKDMSQKSLSLGKAYPIGITLLIGAVIARRLVFNLSGPATAGLILAAMGAAFLGGLFFKGKSGWCSSICPLLPVQRLYGQTPFIKIANTQCDTCVGCAKNCYDFNPGVAYLADQYDPNPNYRNFRRFFASIFPGLILGYYLVPGIDLIGPGAIVLQMLMYMAGSLAIFNMLDLVVGSTRNVLPVLFAALAINLYYWFAAPLMAKVLTQIGVNPDLTLIGGLRTAVAIGSLIWVGRSLQVERLFLRDQVRRNNDGEIPLAPVVVETVRLNRKVIAIAKADAAVAVEQPQASAPTAAAGVAEPSAVATSTDTAAGATASSVPAGASAQSSTVQSIARSSSGQRGVLRIEPSGVEAALRSGRSLLDVLEGCGADIHAGCRAGACGADPIAVTGGASCLAPIGDTERATLARLGHASNTRMACMARVRQAGAITVELKPQAAGASQPEPAVARDSTVAALVTQPATLATRPGELPAVASSAPRTRPAVVPTLTAVARIGTQPRSVSASANDTPVRTGTIRRVVIVGNGIAGVTAAEEVRRLHPDCRIDLVTRDRQAAYNRMAVASLLTRRSGMQGLYLKSDAWYADHRITCWLNTRATGLDTTRQIVTLATGDTLGYDRLIIATGSQAWVPPIEGFASPGCFALRHAGDAMAIRAHMQRHEVHHATVVGAGLLGLEAAAALRDLKLDVSVLSQSERVLERQIDATASSMVREHLRSMSIKLVPNAQLTAVQRNSRGRVRRLQLADGRTIHSELVVACVGTRADLDLARLGGLATGRGILVNAQMRSSVHNIFAAGDVAEFDGQMPGLWGVAGDQARVAAQSALGMQASYQAAAPLTTLKLPGIVVRSAGQAEARGELQRELVLPPAPIDDDSYAADSAEAPGYAKLVIEGRKVVGAVFVGDDPQADDLLQAASRQADLSSVQELLSQRGNAASAPTRQMAEADRQAA